MTIEEIKRQIDILEEKRDALTSLKFDKIAQSDLFIESLKFIYEHLRKNINGDG
jgi:hypothetical protein